MYKPEFTGQIGKKKSKRGTFTHILSGGDTHLKYCIYWSGVLTKERPVNLQEPSIEIGRERRLGSFGPLIS